MKRFPLINSNCWPAPADTATLAAAEEGVDFCPRAADRVPPLGTTTECGVNKWLISSGTLREGETLPLKATAAPVSSSPSVVSSFRVGSAFSLLLSPLPHSLIFNCLSTLPPRFLRCWGETDSGVGIWLAVVFATTGAGTSASLAGVCPVMAATSSPSSWRLRLNSSSRALSAFSFFVISFSLPTLSS